MGSKFDCENNKNLNCYRNFFSLRYEANKDQSEKTFSGIVTKKELSNYTSYKPALCKTQY